MSPLLKGVGHFLFNLSELLIIFHHSFTFHKKLTDKYKILPIKWHVQGRASHIDVILGTFRQTYLKKSRNPLTTKVFYLNFNQLSYRTDIYR